jgi:hypothetical protein
MHPIHNLLFTRNEASKNASNDAKKTKKKRDKLMKHLSYLILVFVDYCFSVASRLKPLT